MLVNNAGYGLPGRFDRPAWTEHEAFLRVMVTAVCELTYRLLPGMVERRWGRIINVASLAGHLPAPAGHTLYAASKAFLIRFSEALAAERAQHGVLTTAVCPGFTLSEFHDVTGTRAQVSRMPKLLWMDAATVAEQGYAAVMRGQAGVHPGRREPSNRPARARVPGRSGPTSRGCERQPLPPRGLRRRMSDGVAGFGIEPIPARLV